jgi:hypothetical protein
METGLYDMVVDTLHQRQGLVKAELSSRFKKAKPFRTEPVSDDEVLYHYNKMNNDPNRQQYIDTLIQRHGYEGINTWIYEMEQLKKRRNPHG